MPRIMKRPRIPSSDGLPATPGSRITTSPVPRLGRLPNWSIATTSFTLVALRFSVSAAA